MLTGRWVAGRAGGTHGGRHAGRRHAGRVAHREDGGQCGGGVRSGQRVRTVWGQLTDGAWGPPGRVNTGERGSWWWGGEVVVGEACHWCDTDVLPLAEAMQRQESDRAGW